MIFIEKIDKIIKKLKKLFVKSSRFANYFPGTWHLLHPWVLENLTQRKLLYEDIPNECTICQPPQSPRKMNLFTTSKSKLKEINEIHLKYVDNLTIAESINLTDKMQTVPLEDRPQPVTFHARTGHELKPEDSKVLSQMKKIVNACKRGCRPFNFIG